MKDIVIVGGGIAGLSVAAKLAPFAAVAVLEREPQLGYHSSGRSATMFHNAMGSHLVRALSAYSEPFFRHASDFSEVPLSSPRPGLFVMGAEKAEALRRFFAEMQRVTDDVEMIGADRIRQLAPVLRTDAAHFPEAILDHGGRRIDSDALLQGYARQARRHGAEILSDHGVTRIAREGKHWRVETAAGELLASVLINAAGAWADVLARMAGANALGLTPLRRTLILFDGPPGVETKDWPFVRSLEDQFYFLPEAGRLLGSAADENPSAPRDAQAEEFDVALAAHRIEEATTMQIRRIHHRWAGLRSFTPDRKPAIGFAPDAPGFFWLAGQGGYGLQTSPALSDAAASLVLGRPWPERLSHLGIEAPAMSPARFP